MHKVIAAIKYMDRKMLRNIVIMIVINIIFIIVCIVPAFKTIGTLRQERDQKKNDIARSQQKVAELGSMKRERDNAKEFIEQMVDALITESEKSQLLGEISDIAKDNDVTIQTMRPIEYGVLLPEGFTDHFVPISFEIRMEAGYHDFGTFVNELERQQTFLAMSNFRIVPIEEQKKLDIMLVVTTYAKKK